MIPKFALHRPLLLAVMLTPVVLGQVDRRGIARTPTPPAANTADGEFVQRASCVLQIDPGESNYRQVDAQLLTAMLTSTALADPVAKTVLGLGPDEWQKAAQIEVTPAGQMAVRLNVTVLPQAKAKANAARDLLGGLAEAAKTSFEQTGTRQERAAVERRTALEKQLAEAQRKLDAATAALGTAGRRSSFNNDPEAYAVRNTAAERAGLEITLAGQKARLEALEAEINALTPNRPADAATRPAAAPTQPPAPMNELRERLIGERVTLRLSVAESKARLDAIAARVPGAPASQPAPVDIERLQSDQNFARQQVQNLRNQLDETRFQRRAGVPARLLIMDGRKDE